MVTSACVGISWRLRLIGVLARKSSGSGNRRPASVWRHRLCGAVAALVEIGWRNLRLGQRLATRRWRAGGDHAMEKNSTTDAAPLFSGEAWFDPMEAELRERVRGFLEDMSRSDAPQSSSAPWRTVTRLW